MIMAFFKDVLFGISGLSMIFWVAVIGLWHVEMFPRIFSEDRDENKIKTPHIDRTSNLDEGGLRPRMQSIGLINRGKYTRKSFVVADFNPLEKGYSVNRLYTSMILSLGVMSFIVLGYALHSGFNLPLI